MNPTPGRSLRFRLLRAKGPAPCQPRAAPWVTRRDKPVSPEGATQAPRPNLPRPYRAKCHGMPEPRAMPWAGMGRTVGAEIDQQVHALYGLTPEEIAIVEGTAK